ncbi:MAG: calcium-binding EF-hand-containing protein [Alphaproteobacteria bacterium]|nr:calcium-binding EF-hand-containing protein [Alphaproteobacteria bacterium]
MTISGAMVFLLAQAAAATAPVAPAKVAAQPQLPTKAAIQTQVKATFDRLDTNKDGWVDKAEAERGFDTSFKAAENAAFARFDTNKDGSISRAEFDASTGQPSAAARSAWITLNDVDKNGRVALAEATAKALGNFDRMDTDKNGVLSAEEIRAARARRR